MKPLFSAPVVPAIIEWRDDEPWSTVYQDVYFSKKAGIEESTAVFIRGNDLETRFKQPGNFSILETGFGTGLNFLIASDLFERTSPSGLLHFFSVEKHPLKKEDLIRALRTYPGLPCETLIERYAPWTHGFHHIVLSPRVILTLMIGDVSELLPLVSGRFDALFLDGFAPRQNEDMWSREIALELARISGPGTTLASFTSAGHVRRALIEAGFAVEKTPGFGTKREMIRGSMPGTPRRQTPSHAVVIGAGIAGASTAFSLAKRGVPCTIIDRQDKPAREGSGNRRGVFQPVLAASPTPWSRWTLAGFEYLCSLLRSLNFPTNFCGVFQAAEDEKELQRMQRAISVWPAELGRILSRPEASRVTGVDIPFPGVLFPGAGFLSPSDLTQRLILQSNAQTLYGQSVARVEKMDSGFRITTAQTTVDADCLFYCAGTGTPQFVDAPVSATRGQIHYIPPWNETLRTVICADGYLIPGNDFWTAGSTYSRTDTTSSPHIEGQNEILEKLRNAIPDVPHFETLLDGRVGYRISAKDRFAIFGQLGDHAFLSTAHGSRGIVSAPLAAEVIASLACGMPVPVESDLMNHFQNRYAIKHKL